jgi:hypothetical protein
MGEIAPVEACEFDSDAAMPAQAGLMPAGIHGALRVSLTGFPARFISGQIQSDGGCAGDAAKFAYAMQHEIVFSSRSAKTIRPFALVAELFCVTTEPLQNMTIQEIAQRLVTLCRDAKWEEAQKELYAEDVISIEPYATPAFAKETKGLPAIIEKGRTFTAMIETLHRLEVSEPVVAGSSFACTMRLDVTMKGQGRMDMTELCVYNVKDGKVVSEQFHV